MIAGDVCPRVRALVRTAVQYRALVGVETLIPIDGSYIQFVLLLQVELPHFYWWTD
jgi:hypothetical protein